MSFSTLILTLEHFDSYFRGDDSKHLKKHMDECYGKALKELKIDFHQTTVSAPEIQESIATILKSLNISPRKWNQEFYEKDLTIYNFLLKLAQKNYSQANYLIDLIDEKTSHTQLSLLLGGGFLSSLIIVLLATSSLPYVLEFTRAFLSLATSFPLLGFLSSIACGAYNFYSIVSNRKIAQINRFRDVCFLLLGLSAKLSASLLLLAAGAVMSPLIAGIFVAASGVDVIKEFFCLIQEYLQYKSNPPLDKNSLSYPLGKNDQLSLDRDNARRVCGYEKRRDALLINLGAALLLVGIGAISCFVPGGLAVSIPAIIAIGLIYLIKYFWLKHHESVLNNRLQQKLNEIEQTAVNDPLFDLDTDLEINSIFQSIENADLSQKAQATQTEKVKILIPTPSSTPSFAPRRQGFFPDNPGNVGSTLASQGIYSSTSSLP